MIRPQIPNNTTRMRLNLVSSFMVVPPDRNGSLTMSLAQGFVEPGANYFRESGDSPGVPIISKDSEPMGRVRL